MTTADLTPAAMVEKAVALLDAADQHRAANPPQLDLARQCAYEAYAWLDAARLMPGHRPPAAAPAPRRNGPSRDQQAAAYIAAHPEGITHRQLADWLHTNVIVARRVVDSLIAAGSARRDGHLAADKIYPTAVAETPWQQARDSTGDNWYQCSDCQQIVAIHVDPGMAACRWCDTVGHWQPLYVRTDKETTR